MCETREYLFVGGSLDGCRQTIHNHPPVIRFPVVKDDQTLLVRPIDDVVVEDTFVWEEYTLKTYSFHTSLVCLYALTSLDDFDIMNLLVEKYRV